MSSLAHRSFQVHSLSRHDLPHIEQNIRRHCDIQHLEELSTSNGSNEGTKMETSNVVTSWFLVVGLWKDKLGLAATSELPEIKWKLSIAQLLEFVNTAVGYLQLVSAYELVKIFSVPQPDKSYAYLLCWVMLLGQMSNSKLREEGAPRLPKAVLTTYLAVRENYLLHNPVRMSIASIVCQLTGVI